MTNNQKDDGYTVGELLVKLSKFPPSFRLHLGIVSADRLFKMDGKLTDIIPIKDSKTIFLSTHGGDVSMPPPLPPKS